MTTGLVPSTLTVKAGTKVVWNDGLEIDCTIVSPSGLFGGMAARGGTYSFIFSQPGTYTYTIAEEPDFGTGTIIVTA